MNFIKLCIVFGLVLSTFGALRKKSHKNLMQAKIKTMNTYADAISKAIIQEKGYDLIKLQQLQDLAYDETNYLLTQNDFGMHNRFSSVSDATPNEYFTEISLQVSIAALPDEEDFAQIILDEIKTEQSKFLQQKETHIGVAMIQELNDYYITIYMLKKPYYYSSCKDQLFFEESNTEITIKKKYDGNLIDVVCDVETTYNDITGGWTRIVDMDEESTSAFVEINDLDIDYTQILWVAKPDYFMDLNKDWAKDWDFNGWMFGLNMFRFGDQWYISEEKPVQDSTWKYDVEGDAVRGTGFSDIQDQLNYYKMSENIESLSPATQCFMRANKLEQQFCSTKFIFKYLPMGERITAISDVETQANTNSDNIYKLKFSIYVR